MKKDIGVYVHIPFCKAKCFYCDFVSFVDKNMLMENYIDAVIKEIENKDLSRYNIKTVYIGGGTPSILDSKHIGSILDKLRPNIDKEAEITIEVNPGTINEEKLTDYVDFGINRISIGLQSADNSLLKEIGRIHTFEDFLDGYKMAERVGFKNINVDLMLGLPNQTLDILKDSLEKVISLNPNHISIYSLILEEDTKLEKLIEKRELEMIDEELERKMYWETKRLLEKHGYIHYEISNFAKKGYMSKHNLDCWNQKEYLGFGAVAHSYIDNTRYSNVEDIEEYINNIREADFEKNKSIHEIQGEEEKRKRVYDAWSKEARRSISKRL